jgi:hypothetical protein
LERLLFVERIDERVVHSFFGWLKENAATMQGLKRNWHSATGIVCER